MVRRLAVSLLFVCLLAFPLSADSFTNFSSGNWSNVGTWYQNGLPATRTPGSLAGTTDTVTLSTFYTITMDVSLAEAVTLNQTCPSNTSTCVLDIGIGELWLTGGSSVGTDARLKLSGGGKVKNDGSLTFASGSNFDWTNGTLTGSGLTAVAANANVNATGIAMFIDAHALSIAGTMTYGSAASGLSLQNGGSITIQSGGVLDIQTTSSINSNFAGSPFIDVLSGGLLEKTQGNFGTNITPELNNDGTVRVDVNTLVLTSGTHSGVFDMNGSTTGIGFSGTPTLLNGTDIQGAGTAFLGNVTVTGTVTATNLSMDSFGSISGGGTLDVSGTFDWRGGTISGSGTTVNMLTGSALNFTGESNGTLTGNAVINNQGTFTVAAGVGSLSINSGGVITNNFAMTLNGAVTLSSDHLLNARIDNLGTFTKSGSGTASVASLFNNSGTVTAASDMIDFGGGGDHSGTFNTASVSTGIHFDGNINVFNTGSALTGTGTFALLDGTMDVDSALTVPSTAAFFQSGGVLTGSANFQVDGVFYWTAGTQNNSGGSGQTILTGSNSQIASTTSALILSGRTISQTGSFTYNPTTGIELSIDDGGNFLNTGTFDIVGDTHIDSNASATPKFTNGTGGVINKSTGTGSFTFFCYFSNNATLNISSGAIELAGNGQDLGTVNFGSATNEVIITSDFSLAASPTLNGGGILSVDGIGASLTLLASLTVDNLELLGGASIDGTGALTVNNSLLWQNGTMSGPGTTTIAAGAIVDATSLTGPLTLDNRTLDNNGTFNWNGTTWQIELMNGAVLNNANLFDAQSSGFIDGNGGSGSITNSGTFKKTGGSTGTRLDAAITNTGTISSEVSGQSLIINAGGSMTAGTLSTNTGALLDFFGGTFTATGGSFAGSGIFRVNGGELAVDANMNIPSPAKLAISSGTLSIGTAKTMQVFNAFEWTGGIVEGPGTLRVFGGFIGNSAPTTLTGDATLTIPASSFSYDADSVNYLTINDTSNLNIENGGGFSINGDSKISGASTASVTYAGSLKKTGGGGTALITVPVSSQSGTAPVIGSNSGTLKLTGGTTIASAIDISGGTVEFGGGANNINTGASITGTGTIAISGGVVSITPNLTIPNLILSAGTLDGSGNLTLGGGTWSNGAFNGPGSLTLTGTFNVTASPAAKSLSRALINDGTLHLQGGALDLIGGGLHTGAFVADAGTDLGFSGIQTFNSTSSVSGGGDVTFIAGNHQVGGAYGITGTTTIPVGSLSVSFNGATPATTGRADLTGGTLGGPGNFIIGNTAPASTWTGTDLSGPGTLTLTIQGNLEMNTASDNIVIAEAVVISGSGSVTVQSGNPFATTLQSGASITNNGAFTIAGSSTFANGPGGGTFINNGTFSVLSTATLFGVPLTNTNFVHVSNATLDLTPNAYTQTAGTTKLDNSNFIALTVDILAGSLIGNGTITGDVNNSAIVAPGFSAGSITINGDYAQSETGSLNIEIGGTTAGTGYDLLDVNGTATLDGTINVTEINGFTISGGQTFEPLLYDARSGVFATENLPPFPEGTLDTTYTATAYQIVANANADLSITKTGPAGAQQGDTITYTIVVTNNGPGSAANVVVSDPLPANLVFSANSGDCTTNFPCSLGTIASGASKTINASYIVNAPIAGGSITNTASVASDTPDPNTTNNSASATTSGDCIDVTPTNLSPVTTAAASGSLTWTANSASPHEVFFGPAGSGCSTFFGSSTTGSIDYSGLTPGATYEWRVQTTYGACDVNSSACVTFTVPNECILPVAPVASVVGQTTSAKTYSLEWELVPGATHYEVQEATNENFTDAVTFNVGNALSKEFKHDVNTSSAFFYRVRAFADCTTDAGPYSLTVRVVIIPVAPAQQNPSANVPAGSDELIVQQVFIPGEPGQTLFFSATTDRPWLTVKPANGTLPPQGVTLDVTADPKNLPNGTFTATVIVTVTGGTLTSHATSVSIPVSINLVTPVTPVATKPGTSEHALIIPAVGHASGLNSEWRSDVRVTNAGFAAYRYRLTFTPSGGIEQGVKETEITVDAGATTALDDIVRNWFGFGTLGDGTTGTLEIVPLDDVENAAKVTVASSRTYNATDKGTLGEFMPAVPFSSFIGQTLPGALSQILSMQQIAQNARYRTNVGLAEASGAGANVLVSVFNASGSKLFDVPAQLAGGQQLQLNGLLAQHNITADDARVEVAVTGGDGKVTAYASVIDGGSGDPLLVRGTPLTQGVATRYVLPGMANVDNGFAKWRSDMRVFNFGTTAQPAKLTFFPIGSAPRTAQITANAGQVLALNDVIKSLFGAENLGGAIHIDTDQTSSLVITGRTYNETSTGTFGQFIPAVTVADTIGVFDTRSLHILQVEDSVRHRTNVGLAEVTGQPVVVEVMIVLPDSKATPVIEIPLAANEFYQFAPIRQLQLGNVYNARVTVRVISGLGRVTAYGAVIDEKTGDGTFVPAQ